MSFGLGTAILVIAVLLALPLSAQDAPAVSPLANSKAAAKAGKATYLRLCQYCHGADGKALENIDFEATNLTDPSRYKHGTEAAQIFNSIKNGAGDDMLPFKDKASDEQIWQLVAFILSIGPEERRPQQD
jgi:mono/diheme cytochrome c family protein